MLISCCLSACRQSTGPQSLNPIKIRENSGELQVNERSLIVFFSMNTETETARCSATVDPHYRTFDGKKFDFTGKCQYVLAKHNGTFEVLQRNVPCGSGNASCTKAITVIVKSLKIYVISGGAVTVDGVWVIPPYNKKGKKGR